MGLTHLYSCPYVYDTLIAYVSRTVIVSLFDFANFVYGTAQMQRRTRSRIFVE